MVNFPNFGAPPGGNLTVDVFKAKYKKLETVGFSSFLIFFFSNIDLKIYQIVAKKKWCDFFNCKFSLVKHIGEITVFSNLIAEE